MFRFIALLIVAMALFWLAVLLYHFIRLFIANGRRVARSKSEFEALDHEPAALEERRRRNEPESQADEPPAERKRKRRRVIASCDPERISPPKSVERYPDGGLLITYTDGSESYYDGFGDIVYFRADPKLNADR